MAIYLDVIWALNFLFDSFLLYLSALILKRNIRLWRICIGGLIGSVIILLSVSPLASYSGNPFMKLFFSVLMVLAAFGYKRLRYFLKGLMALYFSTFLIGGSLIGVHYFIKFDFQLSSSVMLASVKGFGDPISWMFVLLGFPLAWHFSKQNIEKIEMTKIQYDQLVDVFITICGTEHRFRGLIDSGNQLYDPISKMPVMVVSILNNPVPLPETIERIADNPEVIILGTEAIPPELESKMRIIPCRVVGQEHQLIVAMKPDSMKIEKDGECLMANKGLVSFTKQQLSSEDTFQCIVHPKLLTGTKKASHSIKVS